MSRIYTLFIFVLSTLALQAQVPGVQVIFGPGQEELKGSTIQNIIGADTCGVYAVRYQRTGYATGDYYLERYGPNSLVMEAGRKIQVAPGKAELNWEYVVLYNGQLIALVSEKDFDRQKTILYYAIIDKASLNAVGDLVPITEVDSRSSKHEGTFDINFSADGKKMLITEQPYFDAPGNDRVGFTVLDDTMGIVWQEKIEVPFADHLFTFEQFLIDNEGNAFAQARVYDDVVKQVVNGLQNYGFVFISLRDNGYRVNYVKVYADDYFVSALKTTLLPDGKLMAAGFYSDKGFSVSKGVISLTIDPATGKMENLTRRGFSPDFLSGFTTEKKNGKAPEGLTDYRPEKLLVRTDGSVVLVAEQFYMTSGKYVDVNGNENTGTHYHYNDIVLVNITPNHTLSWTAHVPKRQVTSNDGGYYSSYALLFKDDNVYLLFNEMLSELSVNTDGAMSPGGNNIPMATLVVVDAKGGIEKQLLFEDRDVDLVARPKVCKQVSPHEMILYGEVENRYKLGMAYFE